jgi:hypothetical protein
MSQETDFEYEVRTFHLDEGFQAAMGEALKDGWVPVQGIKPVAIFHMLRQRIKPPTEDGGLVAIEIDDSKVFVVRKGGAIEDKDGNIVGQQP